MNTFAICLLGMMGSIRELKDVIKHRTFLTYYKPHPRWEKFDTKFLQEELQRQEIWLDAMLVNIELTGLDKALKK